jgi:hypothetical protein
MNLSEQRKIAIGAAMSELRRKDIKVNTVDAKGALCVLDDLAAIFPSLTASEWYSQASDYQVKLFTREWSKLTGTRCERV